MHIHIYTNSLILRTIFSEFFPSSVLLCSFLWTVECIHAGYHEGIRETPSYHNCAMIVRLAIVLSVVHSSESVHFQQDDLLDAVRLIHTAQTGCSASSTIHV